MHTPEEQKYINKLMSILRGSNEDKKIAIKTTLDALKRDVWDDSLRETSFLGTKKQKSG
ncbi:MAG: hypothetical protein NG747_12310 [Candidatus Brocadia sp.]|nr:hypothetical protein [Candidatus Brocadia sp.]NUO10364.1 hypothetical protein [Candidatus Brocadia sp.]